MDLDQVLAAGVQCDDLPEASAFESGGAGSDESWTHALLRRGWDLSRKAAIAGVAATAAPIVAPPIIILFVAGVALSVPFAAYLASLAATDRLMGALLPPSPAQPYHNFDPEDEESELEFLDASEAPGEEALAFDYWSKTEEDFIMEENESFPSLPLSREPRVSESEVPMPQLANEYDAIAEGGFAVLEFGYESFVLNNREQKEEVPTMVDNEYITLEALPQGFDVSGSAAPVLRNKDNMVSRILEAPVPAKESVQELSVSDNGDKMEDGKCTTEKMESSKEMQSLGLNVTESSDFPVRMLSSEDIVVHREGEGEVSVRKLGQDPHISNSGNKTEERKTVEDMPPWDVNVSESSVSEDNTVQIKIEGEVTMEMVLEEVTSNTDLVTGEVVDVKMGVIATVVPESESLQANDLVHHELQATMEVANVDDIRGSTVMEAVLRDTGDTNTKGVEHHGEGGVCSFVPVASVVTVGDGEDLLSSRITPYVPASRDGVTSVDGRPDVFHSDQKVVAEDKDIYTEEQLRKQLDTLRAITGYRAVPSSTLEGELAGMYVFVGVEPPVSSRDASDLKEINAKLQFLKSIIGVE